MGKTDELLEIARTFIPLHECDHWCNLGDSSHAAILQERANS